MDLLALHPDRSHSREELAEWAPRLRQLAAETDRTQVFMNNCYSDYAQTNAQDLMSLLTSIDAEVDRPET